MPSTKSKLHDKFRQALNQLGEDHPDTLRARNDYFLAVRVENESVSKVKEFLRKQFPDLTPEQLAAKEETLDILFTR